MKSKKTHTLLALPILALISGCGESTGPDTVRRVAVLSFYSDPIVVEAPDSVDRGAPFSVMTRAYGNSCIEPGGTEATVLGETADVTAYVTVPIGASVCDDLLKAVEQHADLRFEVPGTKAIRFHGLAVPADSLITVVRHVVVR